MQWIALLLRNLPLQVFSRGLTEAGMPDAGLAVIEHRPRPHVLAASAAALSRGVTPGLRLAGALAVAPQLLLRERDPAAERALLEELANWAGGFTPSVSLDPPDTVLLEVGSCLRLFGGLDALCERISGTAGALGLDIALAAAPTPLAARWLAQAAPGRRLAHRPGWAAALDALPVTLIGDTDTRSATILQLLEDVGIRRIGELDALPRDGLARRDGAMVLETLAKARGQRPDPRPWHRPPEQHAARLVLPAPVEHTDTLLFAARRLLAGLCAWLAARHAAVDRCTLWLEHADVPDTRLEIITGAPCRDEARLARVLHEQFARLTLPAAAEALRLTANQPMSLHPPSGDLFGDPGAARDSATRLLERLRARLGDAALTSLQLVAEHRPERAWRNVTPDLDRPGDAAPDGRLRPTWLLPEPRRLASLAGLSLEHGPERIESGWWDGADMRRDYFVARTREDALWWVFRDLDATQEAWFLHGYFS